MLLSVPEPPLPTAFACCGDPLLGFPPLPASPPTAAGHPLPEIPTQQTPCPPAITQHLLLEKHNLRQHFRAKFGNHEKRKNSSMMPSKYFEVPTPRQALCWALEINDEQERPKHKKSPVCYNGKQLSLRFPRRRRPRSRELHVVPARVATEFESRFPFLVRRLFHVSSL